MTKVERIEATAEFLYDEHRVKVYDGGRGYLGMWHELTEDEQYPFISTARRLDEHLRLRARLARRAS